MKKIYKVVVNYGKWCDDLGMCIYNTNFEFFSTKKAAFAFIDAREADGEILLPQEERAKKRLKMTDREDSIIRSRTLKSIVDKIKNYEGQIKNERGRLAEQIRNNDKVYMEAEAVEIKRICDRMKEDLDDFLDLLM